MGFRTGGHSWAWMHVAVDRWKSPRSPSHPWAQHRVLHPWVASASHQERPPGPGKNHPQDANTQAWGSPASLGRAGAHSQDPPHCAQVRGVMWTLSLGPPSAFGGHSALPVPLATSSPLTMMASACLASSSETALRKPLACGEAVLGVGMAPAWVRGSPQPSARRPLIG